MKLIEDIYKKIKEKSANILKKGAEGGRTEEEAAAQAAKRQGKLTADILRFQPDSVLLERAKPPLGARLTLYTLALLIVILLVWSIAGRIDRIVTAEGKVVTVDTPVVLQSYNLSLIKDIKVSMGQKVKKGEVLVVLDPTFAQADMSSLKERIASLDAQAARLEAETADRPYRPETGDGIEETELRERNIQLGIYKSRKEEYDSKLKTYDESLKKLNAEIVATEGDLKHRKERLRIFDEFENMRRKLYEKGIESKAGLLEAQKDRHSVAGDVLKMESSIQQLRHQIASVEADRAAYLTSWKSTNAQELVNVRRQLAESRESYNKAIRLGELVDIRSPVDGVVLDVAKRNKGSVADEAEVLVTLVPLDAKLEIEANIKPEEIGYVRVGQPARVKLGTLPFQKHGKIDAEVLAVSEDSFAKNTGAGEQSYYRARIKLPEEPLKNMRNLPEGFAIMPGMTATAEINIGDRRIIEYFIYPILAGFDQSMNEPR